MEIRKVQVTGGSTYVVSLPKDWARKEGIDSGSELELHPKEGSLILEHRGGEEVGEGEMDITGLEGEEITRAVLSMYVSGFDILRFRSDRISSDQRRSLREASQGLAGLEVIEETGETVVFQDLLDSSQLSVHRTVSRMRLIAKSMFGDSVKSLVSDDDSISEDVIERDDDVDRMFAMVSRIFRSALREAVTEESLGIT
ncbi:MAG: AbrB/MazE/SpoVT family DNA-binding domain-containing protein, partial [Halobacteria archaeon]